MNYLLMIKDHILSDSATTMTILRLAKAFSSSINHQEMEKWVDKELNGYGPDDIVPDYRILSGRSVGHFSGMMGASYRNQSIPEAILPKTVQKWIKNSLIDRSGIGEIEALLALGENGENPAFHWPGDLIILCQETPMYLGYTLMDAMTIVSKAELKQILERVKNRLLDFTLSVSKKFPELTTKDESTNIPSEEIDPEIQELIAGSLA